MSVQEIQSNEEFENLVQKGVALIDFNAPWCAPCRSQEPIIKEIGDLFVGKAVVATMNIDTHRQIAQTLGIQSIPTLIVFKNKKEIKRFIGLQSKDILHAAMQNALL